MIVSFFVSSLAVVLFYKWVNPPITYLMLKRKVVAVFNGKPNKIRYDFVDYNEISGHLKLAIIAAEDQKFPYHAGFDFQSIASAIEKNGHSKRARGASTISQQTAKNVFLWDGRNYLRKGLEAYFTFLIELVWGKERILEVYLNVAEMGSLTFGAESASYKYFGKPCRKLSKEQAALIAAVLPNPILFKVNHPTKFIIKKKVWIMGQMNNLGNQYLDELKR